MRLVIVESPYAAPTVSELNDNISYARQAMKDCLKRGEAPFASHLLYTQYGVLNDNDPQERAHGIEAGLAWGRNAEATVVYFDRGITPGMAQGIRRAEEEGRPVIYRRLSGEEW